MIKLNATDGRNLLSALSLNLALLFFACSPLFSHAIECDSFRSAVSETGSEIAYFHHFEFKRLVWETLTSIHKKRFLALGFSPEMATEIYDTLLNEVYRPSDVLFFADYFHALCLHDAAGQKTVNLLVVDRQGYLNCLKDSVSDKVQCRQLFFYAEK